MSQVLDIKERNRKKQKIAQQSKQIGGATA
jgi:hypothetical protein